MPGLWFPLSAAILISYSAIHFRAKRKKFSVEFLFSAAVLSAGAMNALNLAWLKPIYFPLIISAAFFYGWRTLVPLSFLIILIRLNSFFIGAALLEEIAFSSSLLLTAAVSSVAIGRLKNINPRTDTDFRPAKDTAEESTGGNEGISHYFSSRLKTEEEIRELLLTIKHAVFADSVNLFMPHHSASGGGFTLKCSTGEDGDIISTGRGIIAECLKNKKAFYSAEIDEKVSEIGYIKNKKVSSLFVAPVMEGYALTGILAVDSPICHAFSEPVRNTVQMFTGHLARIMERERVYPKIKRDYDGLKILNEESSKLVSSLDMNIIAERLCEGAEKIASLQEPQASQTFFFIASGKQFDLIRYTGNGTRNKTALDLRGTFINIAVENRQSIYMADMKDYRNPVLPVSAEAIRSVIVLPLIYESRLLGLFVMSSGKTDFLDTFQIELLKVMSNQAASSIANANLHAEIEKLATTDGLTGLFNHRVFQEKLSEELKRLSRYSEPTSLLLTDIDFFKKVNDTYGHPVGDFVLKEVSKIIRETIRDVDVAARYGGEEFAAILPLTDGEGAKNIAERLRKAVMSQSFDISHIGPIKITLSIGVATTSSDCKTKEELIEKADRALYHAKHNGRNRSALWSEIRG